MSVEFDEFAKARENPNEDMASKYITPYGTEQYTIYCICFQISLNLLMKKVTASIWTCTNVMRNTSI